MYEGCHPDCLFLREPGCNGCERCTYCGRLLGRSGKGSKLNWEHILPYDSGGRTVVPSCERCNKSKGVWGLKEWLRWVRDNRPALWRRIVEYNKWKRNKIAEKVREVRDE